MPTVQQWYAEFGELLFGRDRMGVSGATTTGHKPGLSINAFF